MIHVIKTFLILLLLIPGALFSQPDSAATRSLAKQTNPTIDFTKTATFDLLKYHDGRVVEVDIQRLSDKFITFNLPNDQNAIDYVSRDKIYAIHFRTGRIELMSDKISETKLPKEWNKIRITYNPEDVGGMLEIRNLDVNLPAQSRDHYYKQWTLESSAEIILKKIAAQENADVILITKKTHYRAYGEPPTVFMKGIAYKSL